MANSTAIFVTFFILTEKEIHAMRHFSDDVVLAAKRTRKNFFVLLYFLGDHVQLIYLLLSMIQLSFKGSSDYRLFADHA